MRFYFLLSYTIKSAYTDGDDSPACPRPNCGDDAEYVMYQQEWDASNRPQHVRRQWSQRQEDVLGAVTFGASMEDADQQREHQSVRVTGYLCDPNTLLRVWCVLGSRSASTATSTRRVALSTVRLALPASLCEAMPFLRCSSMVPAGGRSLVSPMRLRECHHDSACPGSSDDHGLCAAQAEAVRKSVAMTEVVSRCV